MYPLKNYDKIKRTYTHGVKTFYSDFHLGEDLIVPTGTKIIAPFDCKVELIIGKQSGNGCYCYFKKGTESFVVRFLHCSQVYVGKHKQGSVIALSGNTGLSTAPHIHMDISKNKVNLDNRNNFIDPSKFNWEDSMDNKLETYLKMKLDEYKSKAQRYAVYYKRCVEYAKRIKKLEAKIKKLEGVK